MVFSFTQNPGNNGVKIGLAAFGAFNFTDFVVELNSVKVVFRRLELVDAEFLGRRLLGHPQTYTTVSFQIPGLVMPVVQLGSELNSLPGLEILFAVFVLLGVKDPLENFVATLLVVLENSVVHDVVNCLLR